MLPLPSFRISRILSIIVITLSHSISYCGQFDWQYSRLSAPFAVFYNPALIGNNPGYTLGFDAIVIDSADYSIRGAVVVPISKVMKYEEHLQNRGRGGEFSYPNTSYRSSAAAVSLGGAYMGADNYKVSAGFVIPVSHIGSGMSVDMSFKDEKSVAALNLAFCADVPRVITGGALRLALHNIAVSDRDSTNRFGFSIGTGGVPFSDPRMYYLPYDILFYFRMNGSKIERVEGTARVSIDLTHIHTSSETTGQTVTGSVGYNFARRYGGALSHKFFANIGLAFINKSSSVAALAGYGEGDEKSGTVFYNTYKRPAISDDDGLNAVLGIREADSGKILFHLQSGTASVKSWVLRIDDPRGGSVKTFSGGNVIPSSIIWDGLKADGSAIQEEEIFVKLVLQGEKRVVESSVITIDGSVLPR